MIYLLQLLTFIRTADLELFKKVFIGTTRNAQELGYCEEEVDEYITELLLNHFGVEIKCQKQLKIISGALQDDEKIKRACRLVELKREA